MQLLAVHQILIASAIALTLLFGARGVLLFARGEGPLNLALGAASFVVAAALGAYFKKVRARWHALRQAQPKP